MVGTILKKLREERKLTQEKVAQVLGVERTAYSNYELGKREPDIDKLKKLCIFYDVTMDYITGNVKKPDRIIIRDENGVEQGWVSVVKKMRASGLTPEQVENLFNAIEAAKRK